MKITGQILKENRERKSISINEVAIATKINVKTLQAMESGDIENLPPKTFLRGFVRSYANYLALDVEAIMSTFIDEMGSTKPKTPVSEEKQPSQARAKPSSQEADDAINPKSSVLVKAGVVTVILAVVVLIFFVKKKMERYEKETVIENPSAIASLSKNPATSSSPVVTTDSPGPSPSTTPLELQHPADSTSISPAPPAVPTDKFATGFSASPSPSPTLVPTATPKPSASPSPTPKSSASPNAHAPMPIATPHLAPTSTPAVIPAPTPPATALSAPFSPPVHSPAPIISPTPRSASIPLPSPSASPNPKVKPSPTPSPSPSPSPSATPKPTPKPTPPSRPQEIILEALDKVEIDATLDDEGTKHYSLKSDQVQTIKVRRKVILKFNDGGAVNLIVNGIEKGVPGDLGKPLRIELP